MELLPASLFERKRVRSFFCETGQIVFSPAAQVGRLDFQSLWGFEALDAPLCSRVFYEALPEIVTLVSSNNGAPPHLSALAVPRRPGPQAMVGTAK